jgi:peptide/nickel transport system permease protein
MEQKNNRQDSPAMTQTKKGWQQYLSVIWRYKRVFVAHAMLLIVLLAAIFAPLYPNDPFDQRLALSLSAPAMTQEENRLPAFMGTDSLGRDLFSRLLLATRISLMVGFLSVFIACPLGTLLGLIAGYQGGIVDVIVMRIVDALLSLPFVVIAITIVAAIGPGLVKLALVLGLTGWVTFAKLVRGEVLRLKEMEYIEAARCIGCSRIRILFHYIAPQVFGLVLVTVTLTLGQMIIAEAILSFLGLGIPPPMPTLGGILSEAQTFFFSAWWIVIFPGVFLMAIVLSVNIIGDFLRDYFDPQFKYEWAPKLKGNPQL